MKTLRKGAAVAAALAFSLTITACGSNGESTDAPGADSSLSGDLHGQGASSMGAAQETWISDFQSANPKVTVNYAPEGSSAGIKAMTEGSADFGGSDAYMDDEKMAQTHPNCGEGGVINLPVYISPIAIAYNLEGVDELNLTADVIAKIFKGDINKWNDPAIAELNSGVELPDLAITPVHRGDGSGTTENFTDTLSKVAPDVWTYEPSKEWPAELNNGEAAQKTNGVASALSSGKGYIGYIDASGVTKELKTVNYAPKAGGEFVGATAEDAAKVVENSKKVDGRAENDYSIDLDRNAAGYPFVLIAYAMACQTYTDASTGELVNAYLSYVVSEEGQQAAHDEVMSAPLSGTLAENVRKAAASIK